MEDKKVYMKRAIMVSLYCNIVLVSIKAAALMMVNSLAIATDLGISIVGLTVSIILYYSIKLANRPADLLHNYGYGKVEHVCEAMEGVVLIGIALAISSQAFLVFLHPKNIKHPEIGLISCTINLMLNFGGAYYIFKMAKKSASPAVYAEGVHYRLEGFISSIIAASFAFSMTLRMMGQGAVATYVDPVAALLVSGVVIVPSFKMAKTSFFKLLDATVEEDSQMEILRQLSYHMDNFCEFKGLRSRTAGRKKFVEFKLVVPDELSLQKGYKLVSELEQDIQSNIPDSEVRIKMVPCGRDCTFTKQGKACPYANV